MIVRVVSIFILSALWCSSALAQSKSTRAIPETSLTRQIAEAAVEIDPWEIHSAGMDSLAAAIGDARVVMLGEAWHGSGGAIRLRTAIVRFLHERLNFNVLAFEADFYSLNKGWKAVQRGADIQPFAAKNIYPFWSTSKASQPLWHYIKFQSRQGDTLHVTGFDVRHVGKIAKETLPEEMRALLLSVPEVTEEEITLFTDALEQFLTYERDFEPTEREEKVFFELLDRLQRHLGQQGASGFWQQEAQNLENFARYAWHGASRDRAMGENFTWLVSERYSGQKVIVWAHNNHIITDKWMYYNAPDARIRASLAERPVSQPNRGFYFGEAVYNLFGERAYALVTVPYAGMYSADILPALYMKEADFDSTQTLSPAPDSTLEAALARAGHEIAFVNLRPFQCEQEPVAARILDYVFLPPADMRYWKGYDGLLFIRETFGLNENPPEEWGNVSAATER